MGTYTVVSIQGNWKPSKCLLLNTEIEIWMQNLKQMSIIQQMAKFFIYWKEYRISILLCGYDVPSSLSGSWQTPWEKAKEARN